MNPKQVQESLSFTQDVVEGKRKAAKNENEYIYHEEVPDRDQLPKAMGVSLVKGIPFSINDMEVSGSDIFGRLVPMKAHEASSLYRYEFCIPCPKQKQLETSSFFLFFFCLLKSTSVV